MLETFILYLFSFSYFIFPTLLTYLIVSQGSVPIFVHLHEVCSIFVQFYWSFVFKVTPWSIQRAYTVIAKKNWLLLK